MSDYTTTPNYGLYKPTPNADYDLWGDHLNANADKLDQVIRDIAVASGGGAGGGRDIWITDFLPAGQPDGSTDLAAYFQQALDAAAGADPTDRAAAPGVAKLIVPANQSDYIIGSSLYIPSNSHIVIEHGATLKLTPQTNANMLMLCNFAHHVTIELNGTLDGNSSQQFFQPNYSTTYPPTTNVPATSASSGIICDTIWGGATRNPVVQGTVVSHVKITGSGLITNFQNTPCGLNGATNCEISDISMTNSAFIPGGSVSVGGWRNFPFNPATGLPVLLTGTYVAATNTATLTTTTPHYMVPGEEFLVEFVTTDTAGGTPAVLMWHLFIALPGTSGNTLVFNAAGGGVDTHITGGRITNWFYKQADIVGGMYIPATGMITVITSAPHQLVYGQMISSNITGGTAATVATGIFELLDVTQAQGEPPLPGPKNTTLRYRAARSGAVYSIVGFPSSAYDPATGIVTLTTSVAHGLSAGDVVTVALSGSGTLSPLNSEQLCTVGTAGTTIKYQAPPNITGLPAPVITGGTVTGGPTQLITGGTIQVSTKSWNSGFDNCFMDQIRDQGPCIYGGGVNCYIRNSEITRNIGSGPALYSDANSGRCVDCEISGNYVHDNYNQGISTANLGGRPRSPAYRVYHIGTRIFNNYITGNVGGAAFSAVDGLEFTNNYLYANRVRGLDVYGSVGEIIVGAGTERVRITDNTIRDPCILSTPVLGSAVLQVASGTYNNATGAVVLSIAPQMQENAYLYNSAYFTFSGSTSSPGGMSAALEGRYIAGVSPTTHEIHFTAPAGLGVFSITGGQVTPNGFGIVVHGANRLYVANNSIADDQTAKTMLAAIGGTWGPGGVCTGNYYGPRINNSANFPADMSAGGMRGNNFDAVTGFTDGTTLRQPFSNDAGERFPPLGVSVGYNRSGGAGESTFYIGAANATPGGFEFVKVIGLAVASGGYVSKVATIAGSGSTYNNDTGVVTLTTTAPHGMPVGSTLGVLGVSGSASIGDVGVFNGAWPATTVTSTTLTFQGPIGQGVVTITGGTVGTAVVTLTTRTAHGLVIGSRFNLSLVLGTTTIFGGPNNLGNIQALDGNWIATADNAGTSGSTLNFVLTNTTIVPGVAMPNTGLDITAINAGAINASEMDSGLIDTTAGTGGSLLAVDGLGNTRLSGALVHGAMQTATLAAGGTVTVNPNTSFVLVQNASSIATGTVVLPAPAGSYQLAGSELEVRFSNPVGTLTMTAAAGASIAGPPTAVLSAGSSFRFVLSEPGNIWLPRLPDVSGTAPVGGPYLALSGGAVTGATTFGALTTHAAGLAVSGGTLTAGNATLTGTVTLPTTTTGPFLPLTAGGTNPLTGNLTIASPGNTLVFSAAAGVAENINFNAGGFQNWALTRDNTALGSSLGAKFGLAAYGDTGTFTGYLWQGSRGSGPTGQGAPYFNVMHPYIMSTPRATTPGGVVGNDTTFLTGDVQPTTTLGTDPFAVTSGSPTIFVTWTGCGLGTGAINGVAEAWVFISGATAVGGITPGGWYRTARTDNNRFTIVHSSNATSTVAAGGGSAVTVQPSFETIQYKDFHIATSSASGYPMQYQRLFAANPQFMVPFGGSTPQFQQEWRVVTGPVDTDPIGTNYWGIVGTEMDLINRGSDQGYHPHLYDTTNLTVGFWVGAAPGPIFTGTGGGTATNWNTVYSIYAKSGTVGVYTGYSIMPSALVSAVNDPTGHGGVGFVPFGSYSPIAAGQLTTSAGTSVVTFHIPQGGTGLPTQVNGGSVYIPIVTTLSGVTVGGGSYVMSGVTSTSFSVTGTGTAAGSVAGGAAQWVAFANLVPYAPIEFQGSYKHGLSTVNFRSEDGSIIHTQPGNGIVWDDGTGTASITGVAVSSGVIGVQMNGRTGFNGTVPIAKPTGWGTSTGGARAAITAGSTLPQVAAGLAQLLTDLAAYGLLGV